MINLKPRLEQLEPYALWLLIAILLVLLGYSFGVISMSDVNTCEGRVLNHERDPIVLTLIAFGGLLSGRGVGYLRRWLHDEPHPLQSGVRTNSSLQGLLTAFLAVAAGALFYESHGTSPVTTAEPITQYIRCAAASHIWITGGASFIIFAAIGTWLWYPTPSKPPPPMTPPSDTRPSSPVISQAPPTKSGESAD
jgi:hypothetical protein